jgi:hypothetical protein
MSSRVEPFFDRWALATSSFGVDYRTHLNFQLIWAIKSCEMSLSGHMHDCLFIKRVAQRKKICQARSGDSVEKKSLETVGLCLLGNRHNCKRGNFPVGSDKAQ